MKLAVALAGLAGRHAGSGLGAGAVAGFAELLTRDANLRGDACGRFLEAQPHVVAQVGAALRALAAAPARLRPKTSSKPKKSPKMS